MLSLKRELCDEKQLLKTLEELLANKKLKQNKSNHYPHCKGKTRSTQPCKFTPTEPVATKSRPKYRPHNATKRPKVSAWNMLCNMANLVNLSNISSSNNRKAPSESVLFDSGANCCVSNRREDFVGEFHESNGKQLIDGIGKGLRIEGRGKVAWTFIAKNGMYRTLLLPCYYVPTANARIASTQVIIEKYPKETVTITGKGLKVSGYGKVPGIDVQFCAVTKLPIGNTTTKYDQQGKPMIFKGCKPMVHKRKKPDQDESVSVLPTEKHPSLTTAKNINLTEPEKELLRWHHRLGHVSMKRVQWLFRQGILSSSVKTRRLQMSAAQLTHGPLCTACQYAKQRRKTPPGSIKRTIKSEAGNLKQNNLFPGNEVSVDHFICNPRGRLLNTFGKEKTEDMYKGGCIFVDSASAYTHVELQSSLNSHRTLEAKKNYDDMCAGVGVVPQKFVSDNGTSFVNEEFETHLKQFHQTIRHSAVGAHHSNGIAERGISSVLSIARAMMHHQAIHWPDVASVALWPLAVLHAVHVLNRIPQSETGRSPLELFTRKTWPHAKFHELHVWGCPAYVLDSTLSDGKKLPRWKPRSSRCVYVGNSLKHGEATPLVLDLSTGKITAQYHVVFDDWFHTVEATEESKINFDHDDWYRTFGLTEWQYVPTTESDFVPVPSNIESEGVKQAERTQVARDAITLDQPILQRENDPPVKPLSVPDQLNRDHKAPLLDETQPVEGTPQPSFQREMIPKTVTEVTPPSASENVPSTTRPNSTLTESRNVQQPPPSNEQPSAKTKTRSRSTPKEPFNYVPPTTRSKTGNSKPRIVNMAKVDTPELEEAMNHVDISPSFHQAYIGKAANTDPDTYTWDDAMTSPYREEFLKAAQAEIDQLNDKGTWKEDLKCNATTKIIPAQWVFRVKRSPDGEIIKFKARICLRGDLQEDNGENNFSPVAAWSTVRAFLVNSETKGWVTVTIDFSNAFVQSDLPDNEPVWMHMPRGYRSTKGHEYCLRLIKSLYGHKRAPQLWFNHSGKAFKKLGLRQSKHDECLWYGDNIIVVQYVDDCGISAPNQERIDQFVNDLKNLGFELTQEGSFAEFLGIKFERLDDGSISCTQKGLIKKTLEAAKMTDCNPNGVPAAHAQLGADKDGAPMKDTWNYRRICGMLLYLSTNTRPDIAFAVSQVCRFGHSPKQSHATAVKMILRYLKGTSNKGIIIKTADKGYMLDLYVDADYCGLFGREDPYDSNSVRSRMGYIVTFCGWPIVWKSQLQTHLSQSTTEAEYTALSTALRVFLPLRRLIEEMLVATKSKPLEDVRLHATVFEDNQSAYYLATNQRITNRTRYLLAKWHWFWDAYNRKEFSIVKCPTDKMTADYFTKPKPKATFEANRFDVQGW